MKLSEAILLGSIDSPQGYGNGAMFKESKAKCALGTALHAVGQSPSFVEYNLFNSPYNIVMTIWPWTETMYLDHPVEGRRVSVIHAIYSLNDNCGWTRPQIAAWIATIEPQETTTNGGIQLGKEEVQSGQVGVDGLLTVGSRG
jgi:hypothetical protein